MIDQIRGDQADLPLDLRGKVAGLMGEVGKGITSFKRGLSEGKAEIEDAAADKARDITPEKDKV